MTKADSGLRITRYTYAPRQSQASNTITNRIRPRGTITAGCVNHSRPLTSSNMNVFYFSNFEFFLDLFDNIIRRYFAT